MKKLGQLLTPLSGYQLFGKKTITVSGISDDSRKIKKGNLFVAIKGFNFDGHKFIPQVISSGAVAIVGEEDPEKLSLRGITYIKVKDSRLTLGYLCSAWYDNPSEKLTVIGVTGTDGKTTTASLIYSILKSSGKNTGLVSTVEAKIGNKSYDTGFHVTNPEPPLLQKFLAQMSRLECQYAVLEVTSHGLDQQRVAGINFAAGVLTNITHEHLDYHKTFEKYRQAKSRLFWQVKLAVLNEDDPSFRYIRGATKKGAKIVSYGIKKKADLWADKIEFSPVGMKFLVHEEGKIIPFMTRLIGDYNVYNILAAAGVSRGLNIPWGAIQEATEKFRGVVGRMERIDGDKKFSVIVDFAHTPNGLENTLKTLQNVKKGDARIIAVFGCNGERDVVKRPMMGIIATKLADLTVLTAEDPRREDVNKIIEQIVEGCQGAGGVEEKTFWKIPDRQKAIDFAIQKLARDDDIVVVCGKGHEKSMCFGTTEYPWSDQEAVRKAFRKNV